METNTTFEARDISLVRQQKILFSALSFTLRAQELLLIEGQNGSGKSSLLRILGHFLSPTSGDVLINDQSIFSFSASYQSKIHYVGHQNGLKLKLSVQENLHLLAHLAHRVLDKTSDDVLARLQLINVKNTPIMYLSAGQKRRITMAKLLLIPKTIWLLDEPLTSLDQETQTLFLMILESHLKQGGIACVSSHHSFLFQTIMTKKIRLASC